MTEKVSRTKSPMEKGGSLRRVLTALVVLLLASAVFVGAGSAATEVSTFSELQAAVLNDGEITLLEDIDVTAPLVVNTKVTLDLNGKTISNSENIFDESKRDWSLISVRTGGDLTIIGNGNVHAKADDCYAVDVQGDGKLTINGGDYLGNISAVYVFDGSVIINGGKFNVTQLSNFGDRRYLINVYDSEYIAGTTVIINGGSFYQFDPSQSISENPAAKFLNGERTVTKDENDWYTIDVAAKVGDVPYSTIVAAFKAVNNVPGDDLVTMTILAGTFSPTSTSERQLLVERDNVIIQGAGIDKTTIECGEINVDGQGGIILAADKITLKDLTVTTSGSGVDAVKVTYVKEYKPNPIPLIKDVVIENVKLQSTNGHGLNLHGVENAKVIDVTATGGKCGISLASAEDITITGTTATGAWGSIGFMYKSNNPAYPIPVSLTLGEGNSLSVLYSENAEADTLTLTASQKDLTVAGEGLKLTISEGVDLPKTADGYGWKLDGDHYVLTTAHTVTFDRKEGTPTPDVQNVFAGDKAVKPAEDPEKTGYTFGGWYIDGASEKYDFDTPVTAPFTLNATWTINKYTVTYKVDGDIFDTQTVEHGSAATAPAIPPKEGYTQTAPTWDNDGTNIIDDITINAVYTADKYPVTWKNEDGSKVLESDAAVTFGTIPTYNGDIPTKTETDTHTYAFKGWKLEGKDSGIVPVAVGGATYFAEFTAVEKPPKAKEDAAPIQPVILVQSTMDEVTGETTIVATVASAVTVESKTKATIEDADGAVTLTVTFDDNANLQNGDTTLTGKVENVEAKYKQGKAESASGAGEIKHQLTINLKNLKVELPKISPEFKPEVKQQAAKHDKDFISLAMLTAEKTGSTSLNQINAELTGNKVTIVFTVEKSVIDRYGKDNIRILHLNGNDLKENLKPVSVNPNGNYYEITVHGNGFSNYVLGVKEEVQQSSNDTPQGSSVWLQEPLTPTPTETAQPTPTDSVPTDIPTTQPTPTQTESPGFGVLAVLAGLGAVAVLRRK